ncbi:MAG: SPOR domain-containing protein [Xanthomonadales bacterium PRO7]|jgi:DedD protein|nr:SPOR domain-containing protein [Xanthomonadales bacterium PRO7]HMM58147.1 SPOR domain-containing protein [Rudaea sp.]
MDSALKQRLIGAAVLIALAVILVPMFLGNAPPQPQNTTLNLDIPKPPDRDFQTRTMPVNGAESTPAPAANPDKVVTVDTKAAPKTDARPQDSTPAPVAEQPAAPPKAEPAKPVAAPVATVAPPPSPAAAEGRFVVHLGVYADRGHADALVATLKKRGFAAYDEATDYQGKSMQRVRVGPFADRAAAETARLTIKQAEPKVPSSVVELAATAQPTTDAPASALPAKRAGGWAVQLGAFKSEAEANKLRDRLRGASFAGFVERAGSGDATLWKVRAGPYADRAGADKARADIDAKLKVKGMIVTQP